jgi:hypothetical protein
MAVAKTITESLNGELTVVDLPLDDISVQKSFRVILPAAKE